MRGKYRPHHILEVVLLFIALAGFAASNSKANENSKYLDAVREFADNVLKYGRDTYGSKHTPLFVDGLNIHTHEPVKWISPEGERWILSNLASQQNLFRVLVGLTRITGDPKYKQAAMDAIKYAFENLRSPNGLLYWGGNIAYDARSDKVCGKKNHVLKYHYPYYELMWEIDSKATKKFIESFWSAHILDWSNLGMNRIGPLDRLRVPEGWDHEYKGGPAFFESQGRSFVNAGSDLYYAAAILSKQSGNKLSLIWAKRLAHRYIETRYPNVGIAGYVYTYQDHFQVYQLAEDFKGHRVLMGTLFPKHPSVGNPDVRQWFLGELIVSPGIAGDIFIIPWICQFLLGEMLGEDGKEFTKWALDELTAWGKIAYRKKDNSFIPMLTDGTILEGYVCKKGSIFGPKGTVFTPIPAVSMDFWAYALAYRMTGDKFMWEMARNIAQGISFGDIGVSPDSELQLKKDTGCSDPYVLLGFLELYKKTRTKLFLLMAERIGDNIVTDHFYKGFFVPSHKHTYAKFDAIDPLVLLHLSTTLDVKPSLVSRVWPSRPLFKSPYRRGREGAIDNTIIYNLTELSEPPKSLQEAAVCGEIHEIKSLISKGADVNGIEDAWVRTALHYAAMNGNKQVVELLLAKGADVNAEDADGTTALGYAAGRGHKEVAELLIVKGGDVNAADNRGFTSSHNAVDGGHKDVAELLIAEGADINAKNAVGNAPLHYAAERGLKDIAEMFIVNGVDINAKNKEGLTPVDIALEQNHKDIVELLLEKGAEISIYVAAYLGDIDKVKSFIETGVSVNVESGPRKRTPLYWAVKNKHKDVAKLLIDKGADVSSIHLLYYACWYGYRDFVELFIQKGADINSKDWDETPSHYAVWGGHVDVLELLLAHGADANAKDSAAWSLLHYAAGSGSTDMTRLLLNKSADVNAKENEGGQTPLHRAAGKGHTTVAELLIANGADVNAKENEGKTALSVAKDKGNTEIVELLRKHGAKE